MCQRNVDAETDFHMKLTVIFSIFKSLVLITICGSLWAFEAEASEKKAIKAIVFNAFPIFDPRPVEAVAAELFPEKGTELINIWRSKQFEYQWLRALGEKYKNFKAVTEDALVFAARKLDLPLTDEARRKLMAPYASLTVWPDAKGALSKLKVDGYKIVFYPI